MPLSLLSRKCVGRQFHSLGPHTEKALSQNEPWKFLTSDVFTGCFVKINLKTVRFIPVKLFCVRFEIFYVNYTKMPKIWLAAENFVRRKLLSTENFVRRNILPAKILNISCTIKLYQNHIKFVLKHKMNKTFSADKTAKIFQLVPKILSAEIFCPPKFCPIR